MVEKNYNYYFQTEYVQYLYASYITRMENIIMPYQSRIILKVLLKTNRSVRKILLQFKIAFAKNAIVEERSN